MPFINTLLYILTTRSFCMMEEETIFQFTILSSFIRFLKKWKLLRIDSTYIKFSMINWKTLYSSSTFQYSFSILRYTHNPKIYCNGKMTKLAWTHEGNIKPLVYFYYENARVLQWMFVIVFHFLSWYISYQV